jgi:hypothetical protein
MQLYAQLHAPAQETTDGVERDANSAGSYAFFGDWIAVARAAAHPG